jgi:hypothetical protein
VVRTLAGPRDIDKEINLLRFSESIAPEGPAYPLRSFRWTGAPVLDACTVQAPYGHLLVLTAEGALHGIDLRTDASAQLCTVGLPDIDLGDDHGNFGAPRHRLHASSDGKYAAIVVDHGRTGIVVETQSGTATMQLDGGDDCEETVPFSACFLRLHGRNVFVHRTAWNRLDAADPSTGRSLTDRHIATYESGGERPMHYLDYFHGQLRPSPEGGLMFDDGWVWHPVSIPRIWSVAEWLASNPWESEDGASIIDLGMRDDWTQPACWIDEQHLAMWGAADWDEEAFEETKRGPGVRVLEVTASKPSLGKWWPMEGIKNASDLFCDGALVCRRRYRDDCMGHRITDAACRVFRLHCAAA